MSNCAKPAARLDVWCVDLDLVTHLDDRLTALLDDAELGRAGRFVRPADALRYRIAHGALRTILGGRIGVAPQAVRYAYGEHGKPRLAGEGPHFSLSHSATFALVAVSAERAVGVDVEDLRPVPEAAAIAERHFATAAARRIADAPPQLRDQRFLRIWTAMEAILKAEGTGLADGLEGVEIRDGGGDRATAALAGSPPGPGWSVRWLALGPAHVAAVAVRGGDLAVRLRRFA
ncbi:MAG: 4-phosphopantetheinyl transferase [Solirubrobacteraceae bacterium]|nr:4-phosphopantetheinyl transferase [Solirubrobacteraceae bacterium]